MVFNIHYLPKGTRVISHKEMFDNMLDAAIAIEDYETAVVLRDLINNPTPYLSPALASPQTDREL